MQESLRIPLLSKEDKAIEGPATTCMHFTPRNISSLSSESCMYIKKKRSENNEFYIPSSGGKTVKRLP